MTRTGRRGISRDFYEGKRRKNLGDTGLFALCESVSEGLDERPQERKREKKDIFSPASPQKPYKHINSNLFT
jgi:hypothetical protein